jgi:hypothetical protein
MCRECHKNLSDENILKQLQEADKNPKFDEWNTSSVSHLLVEIEQNNKQTKDICNRILDKFEEYLKTKPYKYLPKNGLEPMVSVTELKKLRKNEENWRDNLVLEIFNIFKKLVDEIQKKI